MEEADAGVGRAGRRRNAVMRMGAHRLTTETMQRMVLVVLMLVKVVVMVRSGTRGVRRRRSVRGEGSGAADAATAPNTPGNARTRLQGGEGMRDAQGDAVRTGGRWRRMWMRRG